MKTFVDTTVLVASVLADQPHHVPSREIVLNLRRGQDSCAAHSLAELYSTLTRMPPPYRRTADEAMLVLADIRNRVTPVSLTPNEYVGAISEYSSRGVVGGALYNALIAQCARKARAEIIYTWNIRHFQQLGPEIEKRLRLPDAASTP
jgi:predicted nucleic acid-binding protein